MQVMRSTEPSATFIRAELVTQSVQKACLHSYEAASWGQHQTILSRAVIEILKCRMSDCRVRCSVDELAGMCKQHSLMMPIPWAHAPGGRTPVPGFPRSTRRTSMSPASILSVMPKTRYTAQCMTGASTVLQTGTWHMSISTAEATQSHHQDKLSSPRYQGFVHP